MRQRHFILTKELSAQKKVKKPKHNNYLCIIDFTFKTQGSKLIKLKIVNIL